MVVGSQDVRYVYFQQSVNRFLIKPDFFSETENNDRIIATDNNNHSIAMLELDNGYRTEDSKGIA